MHCSRTLKNGIKQLEKYCAKLPKGGKLSGADAFKMSDTYGFPIDLTLLMCEEKGIDVDEEVCEPTLASHASYDLDCWVAHAIRALLRQAASLIASTCNKTSVSNNCVDASPDPEPLFASLGSRDHFASRDLSQGYHKEMSMAKQRSQEGGNFSRGGSVILEAEQVGLGMGHDPSLPLALQFARFFHAQRF